MSFLNKSVKISSLGARQGQAKLFTAFGGVKYRRVFSYLKHLNWYIRNPREMPLFSNLDESLPLPNLNQVRIRWPHKYSYQLGYPKLEIVRKSFSDVVPVTFYDAATKHCRWHSKGGFPVPKELGGLIGRPCFPKSSNDIRGEIFEIQFDRQIVNCAYDYSDYPVVSADVLNEVDLYFKCITPSGPLPPKVVSVGYFAKNTALLAKARSFILKKNGERDIDVYGRFGSWTDCQKYREKIVDELKNNPLNFVGGLGQIRIYPAYLKELMRAKIAVDIPGQGPISYRLVEGMALGALVVCRRPKCVFPEEIIDGEHYVSFKDDASDIVQVCLELLQDRKRRQYIVKQAMSFYDRNFSPQSMVRRMLRASAKLVSN